MSENCVVIINKELMMNLLGIGKREMCEYDGKIMSKHFAEIVASANFS